METKNFVIKRNSFSFHQHQTYFEEKFTEKFSSNIFKTNNKSYERALSAISRIEDKKVFGEAKKEDESQIFYEKKAQKNEQLKIKNIEDLNKPIGFFLYNVLA